MNKYLTYNDNDKRENQSEYFSPDRQVDVLDRFFTTRYLHPDTLRVLACRSP